MSDVDQLQMMFSEWDRGTLEMVLASAGGDVEAAVDTVLAFETPQDYRNQQAQQQQQQQQQPPPNPAPPVYQQGGGAYDPATPPPPPMQQQMQVPRGTNGQQMVMVTAPPGSAPNAVLSIKHAGRSFLVRIPPGVNPGQNFIASVPDGPAPPGAQQMPPGQYQSQPPPQQQAPPSQPAWTGRGKEVKLPDNFLRPPGYKPPPVETPSGGLSGLGDLTDEQLDMLLSDPDFLAELGSHPEFAQLQMEQEHALAQARTGDAAGAGAGAGAAAAGAATGGGGGGGAAQDAPRGARKPIIPAGMGNAMKDKLKSFGSRFLRRPNRGENERGGAQYGQLQTAEGVDPDDMLPWGDDTEMVTFESTSNALHSSGQQPSADFEVEVSLQDEGTFHGGEPQPGVRRASGGAENEPLTTVQF
eukprot:CAMPEP_0119496450 /NCGR_PEP_ID=MMETSP1344-20130328/19784_1 /TAXON_ID=236787 /ORGANISM="Florenciella parvula, Strain CCMP2471" /LENGTH=412 /DNA_ID=CAMNT_0007532147 /DNA_START=95 /DNA_END=1333 /DNA_ORIENTATION=+